MLGEVICRHESKDVGFEAFEVQIVEGLDGGLLDCPVHPFGLAVGPWVVRFGELVLDAVLFADAVENAAAEHGLYGGVLAAVLWKIGKRHSIIGQHGVDCVRKGGDDALEEVSAIYLSRVVAELDVGELRDAVDGQEHVELALGQA